MQKQLIFMIAILLSTFLQGQSTEELQREWKNEIGISVGLLQGYLADQNFSPLNHTEVGLAAKLKYLRQKPDGKNRIEIQSYYSSGAVKTTASDSLTSDYQIGLFEFAWLRQLKNTTEQRTFYVGGFYRFNLNYYDYLFQSTFSFLVAHSLGIKGQMDYKLNEKQSIRAALSLPLLTNMIRPPYAGVDHKLINQTTFELMTDGDVTSLNKYISLNFDVAYHYLLSNRLALILNYNFFYQRLADRNQFVQAQNHYRVGLNIKF